MPLVGDRTPSVSIRDVATAAGVSHQTVSRVINGSPSVKASTRQAVLETIVRLDFRPNRAAAGSCRRPDPVGHGAHLQHPPIWLCSRFGGH